MSDKAIALNGFGRIGRLVFRQLMEAEDIEVVAANDIASLDNLAYLLRHDSVHTTPGVPVEAEDGNLVWAGRRIPFRSVRDPAELPWNDFGADIVIEATGVFTKRGDAARHLDGGAKKVVITAPGKQVDLTVCMGVNENEYDPKEHHVISNASCTTNCLAPVAKVLDEAFTIESGFLTTVHAYTSSQGIVDGPSKKWRRGRAAAVSIVPTTTGAAVATTEVLPALAGKLDGLAMRVPVANGSIIDFVVRTEREVTVDEVNRALYEAAAKEPLLGILGITDDEMVSADIVGTTYSAIVDAGSTMVVGKHTAKVLAWYDNEWGYAARVVDLVRHVAERD